MGTSLGAYELNHESTFRIFNKGLKVVLLAECQMNKGKKKTFNTFIYQNFMKIIPKLFFKLVLKL